MARRAGKAVPYRFACISLSECVRVVWASGGVRRALLQRLLPLTRTLGLSEHGAHPRLHRRYRVHYLRVRLQSREAVAKRVVRNGQERERRPRSLADSLHLFSVLYSSEGA